LPGERTTDNAERAAQASDLWVRMPCAARRRAGFGVICKSSDRPLPDSEIVVDIAAGMSLHIDKRCMSTRIVKSQHAVILKA
jgi:hypothetical protein